MPPRGPSLPLAPILAGAIENKCAADIARSMGLPYSDQVRKTALAYGLRLPQGRGGVQGPRTSAPGARRLTARIEATLRATEPGSLTINDFCRAIPCSHPAATRAAKRLGFTFAPTKNQQSRRARAKVTA